jgi:hypothetical protein
MHHADERSRGTEALTEDRQRVPAGSRRESHRGEGYNNRLWLEGEVESR